MSAYYSDQHRKNGNLQPIEALDQTPKDLLIRNSLIFQSHSHRYPCLFLSATFLAESGLSKDCSGILLLSVLLLNIVCLTDWKCYALVECVGILWRFLFCHFLQVFEVLRKSSEHLSAFQDSSEHGKKILVGGTCLKLLPLWRPENIIFPVIFLSVIFFNLIHMAMDESSIGVSPHFISPLIIWGVLHGNYT